MSARLPPRVPTGIIVRGDGVAELHAVGMFIRHAGVRYSPLPGLTPATSKALLRIGDRAAVCRCRDGSDRHT